MGNVLRILRRDILRLLKAPAALIVVGALLVLPSIYTWYNVVAFWNPYESTGNLKVSVVNQDVGTTNDLAGELHVGARVTEELMANEKLDFVSRGLDEAMQDLEAGNVYAVYVIPEDFSECLVSPLTGTIKKPVIQYYANEKLGPVSPKITDTAASTLEETINSMFVQTASDAAVKEIDNALNSAADDVAGARSVAAARTNAAMKALGQVRDDLESARRATDEAKDKVAAASSAMDGASTIVADADAVVGDVATEADKLEMKLLDVASDATNALPDVIAKAAQVGAKADEVADDLSSAVKAARSRLTTAAERVEPAAKALEELSTKLENTANHVPQGRLSDGGGIGSLVSGEADRLTAGRFDTSEGNGLAAGIGSARASAKAKLLEASEAVADKARQLRTLVDAARELDVQLESLSKGVTDTSSGLQASAKKVSEALEGYSDGLFGTTVQTIVSTIERVNVTCARLSTALGGLDTTIGQAQSNMGQLSGVLGDCGNALSQTDKLMGGIQDDLDSLVADVRLLADSGALAELLGSGNLNAENISAFLGAPTKIQKEELFHPNAYGSAMAPLFMNLTFWIGAFMLVIICRLEVDDEGMKRVTFGQRYLSRLLLFSGFAVVQALVCCAGVLAIGVQVANAPALFLAAAVTSLAYLSVIYALSASLQHVGKALCVILVFAQIPGGSGLYPLELTDSFFQAVYPFLPFSYGIDALREAIFGFYGTYYGRDLAVLALIFFGMLVAGMVAVPLLSNVTRMTARQVREGGLYNGEEAVVPARPLRFSQVVSALSDREDYRAGLERRYARFSSLYPILIRASIVLGAGIPVALMFLLALDAGEKVVLLTVFLLWLVALVVFLLVVESLRYSFERQLNIDRMSNDSLMKLFFERNHMRPALARIGHAVSGAGAEADAPSVGPVSSTADDPVGNTSEGHVDGTSEGPSDDQVAGPSASPSDGYAEGELHDA